MEKGGRAYDGTDHPHRGGRPGYSGRRAHFAGGGGLPHPGGRKRRQGAADLQPRGGPGDPGRDDAGDERPARLRRAAQALHRAHPVPDCQSPGVGQAGGVDRRRGRLSGQAFFFCRAQRPGAGAAAPVHRLPGQRGGRRPAGAADALRPRGKAEPGLQPGLGGRAGGQPHRDGIWHPAAADAGPGADLSGPGCVRSGVERALLLHFQRHRDGAHPQPPPQDRGRPPEPPQGLHRVGPSR